LVAYLESELDNLITDGADDSKPTAGFQRVIQRAVIQVQSSGHEEVTGANVLVAIFAERESHAAYFLQEQDMTRCRGCKLLASLSRQRLSIGMGCAGAPIIEIL
jgi:ATP-dependent Clp protease ATP-binding subunit ClpA